MTWNPSFWNPKSYLLNAEDDRSWNGSFVLTVWIMSGPKIWRLMGQILWEWCYRNIKKVIAHSAELQLQNGIWVITRHIIIIMSQFIRCQPGERRFGSSWCFRLFLGESLSSFGSFTAISFPSHSFIWVEAPH